MEEKLSIGACKPHCVYVLESIDEDGIKNLKCGKCGQGRRIDSRFELLPDGQIGSTDPS